MSEKINPYLLSDEENYKLRYGKLPDDDSEDMEVYLRGKDNFSYYELKQFQKAQLAKAEPLIRAEYEARIKELEDSIVDISKATDLTIKTIRADERAKIGEWLDALPTSLKSNLHIHKELPINAIANLKAGKPPEEKE